jgi:hypothetical protein
MATKKEKALYRIFDKFENRYLTLNRKSTWATEGGAFSAAVNRYMSKDRKGYYTPINGRIRNNEDYVTKNIEIHIYPAVDAIKVPLMEMKAKFDAEVEAEKDKVAAKKKKEEEVSLRRSLENYKSQQAQIEKAIANTLELAKHKGITINEF